MLTAWPARSFGYALQQNADLTSANWTSVTNSPREVGSEKQVIVSPTSGQNFYRFYNP